MKRGVFPLLLGILLLIVLSSCAGGGVGRQQSWPGLIVVDETVYAANLERIQGLNAETGKLLWSFPLETEKNGPGPFYSTPVLAEDFGEYGLLLVAGFADRAVHALELGESSAEVPDLLWSFDGAQGQYVGSGAVAGDLFLIGNGDGNAYALRLEDGSLVWSFATDDRVWATPVVDDDMVYIASLDQTLYAVDLATGEEVWRLNAGGAIAATPVLLDGYLWVGSFDNTLYKVDPETGTVAWTFEAADWLWATPVAVDTTLYFADVGGHVYALDTKEQVLIWDEPTIVDDVVRGRPVVTPDQELLLVAGFEKGQIHAMDTRTGNMMNWGVVSSNPGRLPGDLTADEDHVYAMPILVQDRIQAFDLQSGSVVWTYPPSEAD